MAGIGIAIGPLAGGLLLTYFAWGSVFFVNIPIVAIGVAAIFLLVPGSREPDAPEVDIKGAALSFVGLLAFFYSLIMGPEQGWANPWVIAGFVLAAALLTVFILMERRIPNPLLNVRFFSIPEFTSGVITIAIGFFALFGLLYVLTIYIQSVLSYTPMQAGLALVPFAIVLLVGSPLVPGLVRKLGVRFIVVSGLFLIAGGMLVFRFVDTTTSYTLVFAGLVLVSSGLTLAQVPSSDAIMGSIPREQAGAGSATNAAIRQIAASLGIALIGGISQVGYRAAIVGTAAFKALPASSAATAGAGFNGARSLSRSMGSSGDALAAAARAAYVRGMEASMVMTAVIALVGAFLAIRMMPHGKRDKPRERSVKGVVDGP